MLPLLLACAPEHPVRGEVTPTSNDEGLPCDEYASLAMTDATSIGPRPADLVSDMEYIYVTTFWGGDGPLTGTDSVTLRTTWSSAWDLPVTCGGDAGVYVSGHTSFTSDSGTLDGEGTLTLAFDAADTWRFAPRSLDALPIPATVAFEDLADDLLGPGELIWVGLLLEGTDDAGIVAGMDVDGEVVEDVIEPGAFAFPSDC